MAITLTSSPATDEPVPVSSCLEWCMTPDEADVLDPAGTFAEVTINLPATITPIPSDGATMTIWGHVFTVDSSLGTHTSTAFKVQSVGIGTAANIRSMLNSNLFFLKNTRVTTDGFNLRNTVIAWIACGEQDNFTGAAMDLQLITDMGGTFTVTNGVTPEFVPGYMIQFRLLRGDFVTQEFSAVTPLMGTVPFVDCDTVNAVCVDMMRQARKFLWTKLPALTISSEIDPDESSVTGFFRFQYGWTYRDENCQPLSGDFAESEEVYAVNAAFEIEDKEGIGRFWTPPTPGDGFLRQDFLTTQPTHHTLGEDSFAWLWLLNSFMGVNDLTGSGTGNPFSLDHFRLIIEIYNIGSVVPDITETVEYDSTNQFQVLNFNVSPERVADLAGVDVSTIGKYGVYVNGYDAGETEFMRLTEELQFGVEHVCENLTDVYFLTPPGGIGTIIGEIQEREIQQEATEICLNTNCADDRAEIASRGGRTQANVRSFERVTWKARANYGEREVEFFRSFKASPERWIQVVEKDGGLLSEGVNKTYIAKRFLVEPGGVKIYQSGEYIDLVATGYMTDIPLQSPRYSG